ncbi:hypothetical protein [uncultured Legionella sp.]|uniref:hypothetical protein n=1 Tax=uncultured Legionella sp. TaxID=210934 RepID=UPI00261B930D|nr:hypothetical protein [uncultured Legionella sp.]
MNYFSSLLITVFFILISFLVSAADLPSDVNGAHQLDELTCVDEATQNCIDDVCLTSDDTNCEDNCGELAQKKCQEQQNE